MPRLAQARTARLSVPKVRRPGLGQARPAPKQRSGLAQRVVAPPAATTQSQPSNTAVPATQSTPTAPLSEAPKTTATPAPLKNPYEVPAWSGQGPDPRDATYWKNVNSLIFQDKQREAEILQEQQRADTDYSDSLQTAIRNRAGQQRSLGENAIRGNLGNSGWLDRNEAEDTLGYTQERSHAALGKQEEDTARAAIRSALQEGFTLEEAGERGEAAARWAQRQQEIAEGGEGLAEPEAPGEAAAAGSKSKTSKAKKKSPSKPKSKGGSGTGGTTYVPPKKNAPKAALQNRRRAR